MNKSRNQNALLIEIMMAVLFFALCATVLAEAFMAAHEQGRHAGVDSRALVDAQDVAEQLYAVADSEAMLAAAGFVLSDGLWTRAEGEVCLTVALSGQPTEAGFLHTAEVSACRGDTLIVTLPVARYEPKGAME